MLDLGMPREILHLDADAFFASVEQRDDPRLRGRPVAVGTGIVASCSYEARRYGVRTAMRLAEAKSLCRSLIVLPGAYPRYEQAARRILAICRERTPIVEVAALDDLYLDFTCQVGATRSDRMGRELREQVRDEVRIGISIGSGGNKLVAAVATKQAKPGNHVRVPAGQEQTFLAPWSIRVLPGVGGRMESLFSRLNVQKVGEIAAMPVPLLRQLCGAIGPRLSEYAHGIDHRPVQPERRQQRISRRTSFDPPVGDPAMLRAMLDYLLERATSWLRFHHLAAGGLTLAIRYGDYAFAEGSERLPPTQCTDLLREAAHDRLGRLYSRRLPLRLMGIDLTHLNAVDRQSSLFTGEADDYRTRLDECKDAIRRRFGFLSLMSGDTLALTARMEHDRENLRLRTPCLTR